MSFIGVRPLRSLILVFLIQVLVFYLILGESFEILFLAVFYLKIIFIHFEIRNKKRFNPFPLLLNSRPSPTHPNNKHLEEFLVLGGSLVLGYEISP